MTDVRTLEDLDLRELRGAPVLVRVDFNVPLQEGRILDTTRLQAALPTLLELSAAGARLALASHCGRPEGRPDPQYSLRPVADALADLLDAPVAFAEDCIGEPVERVLADLDPGGICLVENLRFHAAETKNEPDFSRALARPFKAYVGDAFGTAHRAHASVVGAARLIDRRAAGRLMTDELEALGALLDEPDRPFVAIVGGAKIQGKVDTLINLLPRLDRLVLGGGMANTFLAAEGFDLGESLVEWERLDTARHILEKADEQGVEVVLPSDFVVTADLEQATDIEEVAADDVPASAMAVDVGPASRTAIARALEGARTVFWNGPLGVFEKPPFDAGTVTVAQALGALPAFTVIGGGETVAAARRAGVLDRLSHVSTGGGASLEFLAGKTLPGVAVLERA